jgi:hypothetical protein
MIDIPIGNYASAIRQRLVTGVQVTGVLPLLEDGGGAPLTELQPTQFHNGIYEYAEDRNRMILGDPAVPGGFLILRLQDDVDNDRKVTVEVVDGAAAAVALVDGAYTITLNTGVTDYAALKVLLDADAVFARDFSVEVDGAGAVLATAQAAQGLTIPPTDIPEASDGGLFRAGDSHIAPVELHLECGAGSTVTVSIVDEDGTHARTLLTGVSGDAIVHPLTDVFMLPQQRLRVVETAKGVPAPAGTPKYLTLYAVKRRTY